jgi:hypothetical protein
MFGLVALGYMWCRMAEHRCKDDSFHRGKVDCAKFFMAKISRNRKPSGTISAGSATSWFWAKTPSKPVSQLHSITSASIGQIFSGEESGPPLPG